MNLIAVLLLTLAASVKGSFFDTIYKAVKNNDVEKVRHFAALKNETLFFVTNHRLKVYPECYELAIKYGNKEMFDLLINAKMNYWDYSPPGYLISLALERGETDMALSLLKKGVMPTYQQYKEDLLNNQRDRVQTYIDHGFFPYDGLLAKVAASGNLDMLNIILVGDGAYYRKEEMYDSISATSWMRSLDTELKKQIIEKIKVYSRKNQDNMPFRRDPWAMVATLEY
jgi:hypothetical protein